MFQIARPIWAKGRSKELNLHLVFRFTLPEDAAVVRLTASTAYQLFANDNILECPEVHYGPARAGEGYFRIDEIDIRGKKTLAVLVAGYYVSSFQYCLYPSFLCLEILDENGNVLFATGRDKTDVVENPYRLRRTDKQARQRVFTEVYDYTRAPGPLLETEVLPVPSYLPRRVKPFSNERFIESNGIWDSDIVKRAVMPPKSELRNGMSPFNNGILFMNPDTGKKFDDEECNLFTEAWQIESVNRRPSEGVVLSAGTARMFAFSMNRSALIGLHTRVLKEAELILIFDEILEDGDVTPRRSNCTNAIKLKLYEGRQYHISFEPYTFRYLKVCVLTGEIGLRYVFQQEIAAPYAKQEVFADKQLQLIYDSAVNTYRQNASDILMDCPSRERAGWLCDSFFTGRCEYALTGDTAVETSFLENFAVNTGFRLSDKCPANIVPALYPGSSDYLPGHTWLSTWDLWFIIEVAEFALLRNGDKNLVEKLKPIVKGILGTFKEYENDFGLLEDTDAIFVEWSRANDPECTCGINYPANMVYSGALEAAGRLFDDSSLIEKAEKVRVLIREYGYNGKFFVDNSVRENGKLVQTANTTEVCQYYAFFFKVADANRYPELFDIIANGFGPGRKTENAYPDVPFANAFIGNYLRLMVLMENGLYEQTLREIREYFGAQAEKCGSLWEFDMPDASCCHGFASYAALWLSELKKKLNLE